MKKLFLITLAILSIIGCTQDIDIIMPPYYWQPNVQYANGQYAIGGYTNGQQTRAVIPSGTYENFALYSWTEDSVIMNGYHGVFQGNTWGYTENTKFFDNDEDEYSFIGIIPQSATQSFNTANGTVTVEGLTSFTTDDNGAQVGTQIGTYAEDREFLYAASTVQSDHYNEGATLSFKHGNTKVYLKFTSDNANTEIVDFTPGTQTTIYNKIAQGPPQNTTTSNYKYGSNAPYFSGAGSAPDIADEVNAQWNYYTNADGTGDASTTDWKTGELKPYVQLKPAYYNNDVFLNLANDDLKNLCKPIMDSGYRVCRIDDKPGTNEWEIFFIYLNNISNTTTTGGKEGIIVLPATSVLGNGTDAVLSTYPATINATVDLNGVTYTQQTTNNKITYSLPTTQEFTNSTTRVSSSTTWYTFPASANSVSNVGYTIKFSYTYDGVLTKYDNRVFLPASECQWKEGKYYTYIINIRGKGNGQVDSTNANENDPLVPKTNDITVTTNIHDYGTGSEHNHIIK